MPSYSVIIPARDEERDIQQCLDSVHEADRNQRISEVIVVDNCSRDATPAVAESLGARVIRMERPVSIAALRNRGAEVALGEALLFLDADMKVPPDWLDRVDVVLSAGTHQVLGFVERVPEEAPWFARVWSRALLARRSRVMEVDFLPGRNLCVGRSLFRRVGGFDESLVTSEDKDLTLRLAAAGASVISRPDLEILHLGYERSFGEWMRKEFWRQSSHLRMLRKHGFSPRLVRFPLVSVVHLAWGFVVAAAAASGAQALTAALLPLWVVPGLALAARHRLSRRSPATLLQFTTLYWLRFLVAGTAVVTEWIGLLSGRRR